MSTRPRFLLVGSGSIGKRHVRNLKALGETSFLAFDPREDRRAEVERELGLETIADFGAALDRRPEVVLVTTPNRLHVPLALDAARRGCHLFVEKPVADVLSPELDTLVEIAAASKLVTLVGCNLRFHPGLRRAKALLAERRLGRVVSLRAEFGQYLPDWHPWEDYRQGYSARADLGGGVVLDAIHELDYARWLLGDVTDVAALTGHLSHLEISTEDTASILLRFAGGAFGEVHLDYVQRAYTRACHVVGDEGTLDWKFGEGGAVDLYTAKDKRWERLPGPDGWEANTMYVDEMRHLLACLAGVETPEQDLAAGRDVLALALAAKRSSVTRTFERLAPAASTGTP